MRKRITLLLCAVVAAAGAFAVNAGVKSLSATKKTMPRNSETVCTQLNTAKAQKLTKDGVAPVSKKRAAKKALSSINDICGIYRMSGTTLLSGDFYDSYPEIKAVEGQDSVIISNFTAYGMNDFKAYVNLSTGEISIDPGQVAFYNTYYSADIYLGTYVSGFDTTTPIVGVVNADGTISFEQWICIGHPTINEGKPGFFQAGADVVMQPLNGAMDIVSYEEVESADGGDPTYNEVVETVPVFIEQVLPSKVTVYHFAGYDDYPVEISVNKAQEVTIPKTVIYDYYDSEGGNYYDVYTIGFDENTGDINPDSVIIGTGTNEELSWGPWNTVLTMDGTDYSFYNSWYSPGMKYAGRLYYTDGSEFVFPTIDELAGSGTKDDPFTISNVEELVFFMNEVNVNGVTYEGQYIEVLEDIDVTGVTMNPIGSNATVKFAGNFDGGEHTINGVNIVSEENNVGFFGYNTGAIRNLNLTNLNIEGGENVGGIVGYNYATTANADKVIVDNCTVNNSSSGSIYGTQKVGGIVGMNLGTVSNCFALEDVYMIGGRSVGGIVGIQTRGSIDNCISEAFIVSAPTTTASESYGFGGIVGTANSTAKVSNSIYAGAMNGYYYSHVSSYGGIAGVANSATISNSINYGNVVGDSICGGIAGRAQSLTMENCENAGLVRGVVRVNGNDAIAGGLIGKSVSCTVTNAKSTGDVQSVYYSGSFTLSGGVAGGLVGQANANANTKLTSCYNNAGVLAYNMAGGIVGRGGGVYTNVYNLGEISSMLSGGFVGEAQTGFKVDGGYNMGEADAALVASVADGVTPDVDAVYVTDFGAQDTYGTPITIKDLAAYDPGAVTSSRVLLAINDGDAWNYGDEYTLPTLKGVQDDEALANAAALILTGDDTYDNVTDVMHVGMPDGAEWSVSNNSVLGFDSTDPSQINILKASTDQVTVTVTVGEETKSWDITLNASVPSAIETLAVDNKDVKSVRYFNAAGVESKVPFDGVNIVVKTMTDGSVQVVKVVK